MKKIQLDMSNTRSVNNSKNKSKAKLRLEELEMADFNNMELHDASSDDDNSD